ncbi:kinase-like domain-containing protein [Rhizoctonia solani]|nr:kinase-like domain-containing protein [Rhizoctonia solani]
MCLSQLHVTSQTTYITSLYKVLPSITERRWIAHTPKMWTIHQPKPRTTSPRMLRHLILTFIFLLTVALQIETFFFLDDPPGKHEQNQLPTPSSSPDPRPHVKRLTIPDLVSNDEHFGRVNTLQTAVDTFEKVSLPGGAVLTFDQVGEGEYLLSARPWEVSECRRVNQELWDRLEGHTRVSSPSPVIAPTAQPVALSYLTPPSSPEPVRKRDLVLIAHVDPPIAPEPTIHSDPTDLSSVYPADPTSSESLEYLFDYDYEDDEWADESPCTPTEDISVTYTAEPDCLSDGCEDDNTYPNSKRSTPPTLPMTATHYNTSNPSTTCGLPGIQDLTPQLDVSKFADWPIAKGGFGEVWKGALKPSGPSKTSRPIAVKRLTMYSATGDEGVKKIRKRTARELDIWSRLDHPNILPLLGACSFRGGIGIVSEWQANGNAIEWVGANLGVSRLELCQGVCTGLKYLHDSGIVHGDLRGGNVMISKAGVPRLIDFGLASVKDGGLFSASSTMAGTLRWMAPELQVTEGQDTTMPGDMFAFGMTMLELYTGLQPFSAVTNDIAVLLKYQKGERPPRPTYTKSNFKGSNRNVIKTRSKTPRNRGEPREVCVLMDDETWSQVQKCWDQEPSSRPSANEMLDWFIWKKKRKLSGLN